MSEPYALAGGGEFALHPQLAADTVTVGDWPLCRVLLMNESRYPWLILVPRRAGLRELYELNAPDRQQFFAESCLLAQTLQAQTRADKINIAALGNMVPQLHIHHLARFRDDDAWPAPVWGKHPVRAFAADALQQRCRDWQQALAAGLPLA